MSARGASTEKLLEIEASAWRSLSPVEYDLALCRMLQEVSTTPAPAERVDALVAVSSATLRRKGATLVDSRACCADHLLALVPATSTPVLHVRIGLLVLLAWLRLAAVVERGPESISVGPALPEGALIPEGADPAEITDSTLREQAREAVERHREQVEAWNTKQRALDHMHRLATLLRAVRPSFRDDEGAAKDLAAAMSLAPSVPPALERLLEEDSE